MRTQKNRHKGGHLLALLTGLLSKHFSMFARSLRQSALPTGALPFAFAL
jgi:hypothetical protein